MIYIFLILVLVIIIHIYITLKPKYQHFSNNRRIPKVIYQTYSDIRKVPNELLACSRDRIIKLNPDYKYKLFDNNDIIKYIRDKWGKDMLDTYLSIDKSYGPARADLFRYLILYDRGGIYLDIKSYCSVKFDDIFDYEDEFILCNWKTKKWAKKLNYKNGEFINWFIACAPGHEFLKTVIDNIVDKIKTVKKNKIVLSGKSDVLLVTGPIIFTTSILDCLKKKKYKNIKIYDDFEKINLVYACRDHVKLIKNHYSDNYKQLIKF